MSRRLVAVVAGLAALALAVPASAAPSPDTLLTAGYDTVTMQGYYTVGPFVDGEPAEGGDADSEGDEASPCEAGGLECFDVTGPNGQVNHGTIVSAFVKQFKELREDGYTGIGCLVRHIAQTDWGKGDQQVKTGDEMTEPGEAGEETEQTLTYEELTEIATFCNLAAGDTMDDNDLESDDDEGRGGPPEWANAKKNRAEGEGFTPPGQAKKGSQP